MVRPLRLVCLIPLAFSFGCNGLSTTAFVGTVAQLTISNAAPSAPGTHLEMWTVNAHSDIIRVDGSYTFPDPKDKSRSKTVYTYGLQIRQAITLDDPCMIDSNGNLLTSPDAYQQTIVSGTVETPENQAETVRNRIAQVTQPSVTGSHLPLLAVTPAGCSDPAACGQAPDAPPQVPADASPADRLRLCTEYWDSNPLAYTPNPAQLTAPIHGTVYGFVSYTTLVPPTGYDGIRVDSPTTLGGAQELWFTTESAAVADVTAATRGPIFLHGNVDRGGNDLLHFDLTGPTAFGTAALFVNLADDSVQF